MTLFLTIVAFLVIFSLLILIHEAGHYFMAKRAGVRVDEFGFGLPPKMFGVKKGDTLFTINWIPFGGFVRLYGEDPTEKGALKSSDSFVTKSVWDRTKIVLGGVFMNFLLAWVLLTIGFVFGIDPLIADFNQFQTAVIEGHVKLDPFVIVKHTSDEANLNEGDTVISINGTPVEEIETLKSFVNDLSDDVAVVVRRAESGYMSSYDRAGYVQEKIRVDAETLKTVDFYPRSTMNRLAFASAYPTLGIEAGDILLRINGTDILSARQFFETLYSGEISRIDTMRGNTMIIAKPRFSLMSTVVDSVIDDTPAKNASVQKGDVFVSINGTPVYTPEQVQDVTFMSDTGEPITYVFNRNGEEVALDILPDQGRIGVALSKSIKGPGDFALSEVSRGESVVELVPVQTTVWRAPFAAFKEMYNVSAVSLKMMGRVFTNLLSRGEVPHEVAGPVGIAQMTYVSVQGGLMEVIRFAAILSLSLGVLNVLPFPALDGGRFFFILVEAIIGRPVNQKFEAMLHTIGFALLMLLIVMITWNDISRLISG